MEELVVEMANFGKAAWCATEYNLSQFLAALREWSEAEPKVRGRLTGLKRGSAAKLVAAGRLRRIR
jgi:hypothetical protein